MFFALPLADFNRPDCIRHPATRRPRLAFRHRLRAVLRLWWRRTR